MACRVNFSATSFVRAAAALERTAQVKLSGERLRQVAETAGRRVMKAQQDDHHRRRKDQTPQQGQSQATTARQEVQAVAAAQARFGLILEGVQGRLLLQARTRSVSTLPSRTAITWRPEGCCAAKRTGCDFRRRTSAWAWWTAPRGFASRCGCTSPSWTALGLDFYHLSENVHRARRKVFGEESPEGKAWADALMHVFKHEGCSSAWEQLIPWRAALRGQGEAKGGGSAAALRLGASGK